MRVGFLRHKLLLDDEFLARPYQVTLCHNHRHKPTLSCVSLRILCYFVFASTAGGVEPPSINHSINGWLVPTWNRVPITEFVLFYRALVTRTRKTLKPYNFRGTGYFLSATRSRKAKHSGKRLIDTVAPYFCKPTLYQSELSPLRIKELKEFFRGDIITLPSAPVVAIANLRALVRRRPRTMFKPTSRAM